ncbi:MAG: transposase IS200-family protein [Ignavibacteria bacterium]|nr:transposase IS200-family protein [Ignavibacteria bacterium]
MANTYTQLYIQIIFAVKGRQNIIPTEKKDELYKYITGIVQNKEHKLFAINGMPDHIHIFISNNPDESLSGLVKEIKRCSSIFINQNKWVLGKFEWQAGYGAFSYSKSQLKQVCEYIENQENHHKKVSFKAEYIAFLKKYDVKFDERCIFKDFEDDV